MAVNRILVSVSPGETQIAELDDGGLAGLTIDRDGRKSLVGDLIAGRVEAVNHGLQAAFVDIGEPRSGYLGLSDARPHGAGADDAIGDHLTEGDTALVQVTRDPEDGKGARLTMKPVLTGRDLAFTPNRPGVSLSRRIADPDERARLAAAMSGRGRSAGGFIVRTAAREAEAEDLIREAGRLEDRWSRIRSAFAAADAPQVLEREAPAAMRVLRDRGGAGLGAVIVDDPDTFNRIKAFAGAEMPDVAELIHMHRGDAPLFRAEGVDEMIDEALDPRVALPSGGNIRINETDALVAVDVNTGAAAGGGRDRLIRDVNCEAAVEFARQMRLRNLSGLMAVDFVSMRRGGHREEVLNALRGAVADDPQRCFVGGFTRFGLVEMTRRRKGASLQELICGGPPAPQASPVTTGLAALRAALAASRGPNGPATVIEAAPPTARALERHLAAALAETAARLGAPLRVAADAAMRADAFHIRHGADPNDE